MQFISVVSVIRNLFIFICDACNAKVGICSNAIAVAVN